MADHNPAARVDLDALEPEERASLLRVLDWGVESRNMPHATALHVLAIADRLAPLLAERDEAQAERDALRERVARVERLVGMQGYRFCSRECHGEALSIVRAALADPEAS